jgi:2-polyprenyl-6-methoxyphenol hydroxylase-like FAD-dependent oxidoreductase
MDDYEQTDVLICGCGPTGAMLSGYLGKMGIRNVVFEKEPDITTDPRGIALDDDGIRALQGLGLYEHVFVDIGSSEYARVRPLRVSRIELASSYSSDSVCERHTPRSS